MNRKTCLKIILILLAVFALLCGVRYIGHRTWVSYACTNDIKKFYPPSAGNYYAETDDELCDGFGATAFMRIKLIKITKPDDERIIVSYDPPDLMPDPIIRWIGANKLEVVLSPLPKNPVDPYVSQMDGIKITYISGTK